MREMTLREVCKAAGVTRRAVQGYEKIGIVKAAGKNKYGYLLYDEVMIERIRMIRQYQDFGFSVKEIKALLEASDEMYLKMMTEQVAFMKERYQELEKNIERAENLINIRLAR